MTSRLMLVVALFGIFASATVTFAQYQQSREGRYQEGQQQLNQRYGGQQGTYQGRMPLNLQSTQGNPEDMMKQYHGQMPSGGFDPNMDPARMGGDQGMMQGPGKDFFSRMVQKMNEDVNGFEEILKSAERQASIAEEASKTCTIMPSANEFNEALSHMKEMIQRVKGMDGDVKALDFDSYDMENVANTVVEEQQKILHSLEFCEENGS